MTRQYYVLRAYRNGRQECGYDHGRANRFGSLSEAEANAEAFAADVLPTNQYDRIIVGSGAVLGGWPVGGGRRLSRYSWSGDAIRRASLGL